MASGCRRLAVGGAPIGLCVAEIRPYADHTPVVGNSRALDHAHEPRGAPQRGGIRRKREEGLKDVGLRRSRRRRVVELPGLEPASRSWDSFLERSILLRPSMNDPPAAERPRQDNSREPFLAKPFGAPLLRAVRDGRQPRASARSCPQLSTWPSSGAAVWNASMPLTTTWRGTWDPNDRPQDGDAPEGGTSHAA